MDTKKLSEELGLDLLVVRFENSAVFIDVGELANVPDHLRTIVARNPLPEGTNHVYLTIHGEGKLGGHITCYDLMCRHRENYDPEWNRWQVDEFLDLREKVSVE
jgi:hypothetical protein